VNIIEAINDDKLFRGFLGDPASWESWLVALRCVYGLQNKGKAAQELIRRCTGRDPAKMPKGGFDTTLFLTGRRSGKSRTAAVIGAFEASLAGREARLAKGETGIVVIVSPTRSQSRIVKDYLRAIYETPLLAGEVIDETKDGFELKSGVRIEILAGDFRSIRGFSVMACVVDEVCFFGYDADSKVKSDTELVRAIKPALATLGGKIICISSPYARKGWAFRQYEANFSNDNATTLVWNAPSRVMNPTLPQRVVDDALAEDLAAAKAEYLGEFRDDVATFLPREVIEAVVVKGRKENQPLSGVEYRAFVDISGGRVDDAAIAIAHREKNPRPGADDNHNIVVIDAIRRYMPPFSPSEIVADMCRELARWGIRRVVGDNYSAEFVKAAFESRGVSYQRCTTDGFSTNGTKVAKPKGQLYLELLPRLCAGAVELLDNDLLINQLAGLERRTRAGGRDIIDHGPNGHDDIANVVAGVVDCFVVHRNRLSELAAGVVGFGIDRPSEPNTFWHDEYIAAQQRAIHEARQAQADFNDRFREEDIFPTDISDLF
jgi:hypothetical protein